jgi:hypothetical protein
MIDYLLGVATGLVVLGIVGLLWRKDPPQKPSCFGSSPNGQERAENDCFTCPIAHSCQSYAAWRI